MFEQKKRPKLQSSAWVCSVAYAEQQQQQQGQQRRRRRRRQQQVVESFVCLVGGGGTHDSAAWLATRRRLDRTGLAPPLCSWCCCKTYWIRVDCYTAEGLFPLFPRLGRTRHTPIAMIAWHGGTQTRISMMKKLNRKTRSNCAGEARLFARKMAGKQLCISSDTALGP